MSRSALHRGAIVCATLTITVAGACRDAVSPPAVAAHGLAPRPGASLATAASRDIPPTGQLYGLQDDPNPPPRTRYRMEYHRERVLTGDQDVYFIWYGNWTGRSADQQVLTDLASSIGNTPYLNVVRLYSDTTNSVASSSVIYGGSVTDNYSHGTTLSDADMADILAQQFYNNTLPDDPQGIFVFFASPDVVASSGQDVTYCAMHRAPVVLGAWARFIYVGAPSRAPSHCAPQLLGPNGTVDGDGMAYLFTAELANVLTDPLLATWYDRLGLEVADKCAWTFGTTYKAANGSAANVHLGVRDYLLPQLWVPSKNGGACALHW